MSADNSTDADPIAHWSFETKQVRAGPGALPCGAGAPPACGGRPDPVTTARALPIYQATSYTFDDTAQAAALFGREPWWPFQKA